MNNNGAYGPGVNNHSVGLALSSRKGGIADVVGLTFQGHEMTSITSSIKSSYSKSPS